MAQADPLHIENLNSNVKEVLRLVEIHTKLTGTGRGRRHNMAILNKSGIVLAVSCWEAFIEDVACQGFAWLLERATSPTMFPRKVLTLASKELREAPDVSRVWDLADTGWRAVLAKHRDEMLRRTVGKLNTPRPKQVDELFGDLLGIAAFSSAWYWQNTSNAKVKQSLEDLVTLRGEIAYRVVASSSFQKSDVSQAARLVQHLAVVSSNTVRKFIMTRIDEEPWAKYEIGSVS